MTERSFGSFVTVAVPYGLTDRGRSQADTPPFYEVELDDPRQAWSDPLREAGWR